MAHAATAAFLKWALTPSLALVWGFNIEFRHQAQDSGVYVVTLLYVGAVLA